MVEAQGQESAARFFTIVEHQDKKYWFFEWGRKNIQQDQYRRHMEKIPQIAHRTLNWPLFSFHLFSPLASTTSSATSATSSASSTTQSSSSVASQDNKEGKTFKNINVLQLKYRTRLNVFLHNESLPVVMTTAQSLPWQPNLFNVFFSGVMGCYETIGSTRTEPRNAE